MTLTVWTFRGSHAAGAALPRLEDLVSRGRLELDDAVLVAWFRGRHKPATRALGDLAGGGMLSSGGWALLLALIFVVPIAGPAFGAAAGAFAGALADFGIDDDFVKRVRDEVTPGTSALFALGRDGVAVSVADALSDADAVVLQSQLSPEQERRLRAALGAEPELPLS